MTGFNRLILGIFALLLTSTVFSASANAAAPDYAKILNQQPALPLVYTPATSQNTPQTHKPGLPSAGKLRVYWFWGAKCPCSKKSETTLTEFATRFPDIEIIVVHSNADETAALTQKTLSERALSLPVYQDDNAKFAIALNARATPEAYVFDHNGIIYQGRTDTLMTGGPRHNWVTEAVQQYRAGNTVQPASRRAIGCAITRP